MRRIFLIGPPGSGKTAAGEQLGRITGWRFQDTDRLIEQAEGATVSEIFARAGEAYFRMLESSLLASLIGDQSADLLAPPGCQVIYATGGGLPCFGDNLLLLASLGDVVYLSAEIPVLVKRLQKDEKRPLLAPGVESAVSEGSAAEALAQRLSKLIAPRLAVYGQAGYKIDTSSLSPEEVAHEIMKLLALEPGH